MKLVPPDFDKIRLLDKLRGTSTPTDALPPDALVPLPELAHNHVALAIALRDAGRPKDARATLKRAEQLIRSAGTKFQPKWLEMQIETPDKLPAGAARRGRNLRRPGTFVQYHGRQ